METILSITEELMKDVINDYEREITKIRTGRANPNILDNVMVRCYGDIQPLKTIATIKVPEAKQILITPYDQNLTKAINESILHHNLQVQIRNEANAIRLIFPSLTEESRKNLVKELGKLTEKAKVNARNVRREVLHKLKNEAENEDNQKYLEQEIQKITDHNIEVINKIEEKKSTELLQI